MKDQSPGSTEEFRGSLSNYNVHLGDPLAFGVQDDLLPPIPDDLLPTIHIERATRPTSQGPRPLMHISLETALASLQLLVPTVRANDGIVIQSEAVLPTPASVPDMLSTVEPGLSIQVTTVSSQAQPVSVEDDYYSSPLQLFDPLYALALYIAASLGTMFFLDLETRYATLWAVLAIFGLLLTIVDTPAPPERVYSSDIAWGAGVGLLIGIPLLLLAARPMADAARLIFTDMLPAEVFMFAVFAAPLAEGLFFRGILQDVRGLLPAILGVGISTGLLFWPAVSAIPLAIVPITLFFTALGGVYSFIRERYGLTASLMCQVMIHFMLLVMPLILTPRIP